jgi:hypothetical protein
MAVPALVKVNMSDALPAYVMVGRVLYGYESTVCSEGAVVVNAGRLRWTPLGHERHRSMEIARDRCT